VLVTQDGGRNGVAKRGEENEEMLDATGCWHLEGLRCGMPHGQKETQSGLVRRRRDPEGE
jgi:hypothetical protein